MIRKGQGCPTAKGSLESLPTSLAHIEPCIPSGHPQKSCPGHSLVLLHSTRVRLQDGHLRGPRESRSQSRLFTCWGSCKQWGQPSGMQTHKAGGCCSWTWCQAGLRAMPLQHVLYNRLTQPASPSPWGCKPPREHLKRVRRGLWRWQQKLQGHAPIVCGRQKK